MRMNGLVAGAGPCERTVKRSVSERLVKRYSAPRLTAADPQLDPAARAPAPGAVVDRLHERVDAVRGGEAAVEVAVRDGARAVDEDLAAAVAEAQSQRAERLQLARERVRRGGRAERGEAVGEVGRRHLAHDPVDEAAGLPVVAEAAAEVDAAVLARAACRGHRALRGPGAEAGRERVGTRRGEDRVAEAAVEVRVERHERVGVVGKEGAADLGAQVEAAPGGRLGLRLRPAGEHGGRRDEPEG
jgi:hypothetical protein